MAEEFLTKLVVSDLSHGNKEIFYITSNQTTRKALEIMVSKNVYAIPVYEDNKPLGLLNLRSIVSYLVHLFYGKANIAHNEPHKIQKLTKYTFSNEEINSITEHFNQHPIKGLITEKPVLRSPSTSLKKIIIDLSKNERVPIVDKDGKIVDIISQAVVLKFLLKNLEKLGPKVDEKVENLHIITSPVQTVPVGTSVIVTFAKMIEENFSSMGITDESNQITGIVSFKDIKGAAHDFRSLFFPTEDYINSIRREDYRDILPTVNCRSTDTLSKVIAKLDAVGIHRLFVTNEKDKVHQFSGILTLANVLGAFVTGN